MSNELPRRLLTLWAASYLGCAGFLLGELAIRGEAISMALLTQLLWLGLLGSVPVFGVLGSAWWVASARGTVKWASTVGIACLVALASWGQSEFLSSGPHWATHPQRSSLRLILVALAGLAAGSGWAWLLWGYRRPQARWRRTIWLLFGALFVAACSFVILRYRAYDFSVAQLVLPACVLCAALVHGLARGRRHWAVVLSGASACLLLALGSQVYPGLAATGERETIAKSRAGALTRIYIIPNLRAEDPLSSGGLECPSGRPVVEEPLTWTTPARRRNVIVITVDALRKDVVGMVANDRPVTPELSHWATSGVSFTNATTTYPATLFAVGSAFTGLSPAELYLFPGLPETIFTRSRGHVDRHIAVLPEVSWFRLPIVEELLARAAEIDFADTDSAATDLLIEHLRDARNDDQTVMAWIHYYAPHDPYRARPSTPMGPGRKNAYFSEVAHFDRELGRLMRYLEDDQWLSESLVVFFSDHGEALGEKSYWGHHVYLNGWMTDIPLVLWHEDLAPGTRNVGVGLADVAPTVLHFLGLPMPTGLAAESLFTLSPHDAERPTFAEAFPIRGRELFDSLRLDALDDASIRERLRQTRLMNKGYEPKIAITQGRHRLIRHRAAGASYLFDRDAGSRDERDVADTEPERAARLGRNLLAWEEDQLRRIRCRLNLRDSALEAP
ncbi:MAG: sulfatase-like hydrolase/transferase [Myxococcales bacterium]|nr:sulfatase-like hydrolase/transferase [Myxococcales bacterium]MDH3483634.1 sulfatase-like hydrolase/transferase [Myxococcales bacterium]